MAHRRASIKKIRIDKRRNERNAAVRSRLKSAARRVERLLAEKKAAEAAEAAKLLYSEMDRAVKKGIIHKNQANRGKSRVSLKINACLKAQKPSASA